MGQAKNKLTKAEVSASVLKAALKTMQTLKVDKVHVSTDGYIFPKACDARAYVGKDGRYTTLTRADCRPEEKDNGNGKSDASGVIEPVAGVTDEVLKVQSANNDPLINEHKKEA